MRKWLNGWMDMQYGMLTIYEVVINLQEPLKAGGCFFALL
jgi:hypothetical protein